MKISIYTSLFGKVYNFKEGHFFAAKCLSSLAMLMCLVDLAYTVQPLSGMPWGGRWGE